MQYTKRAIAADAWYTAMRQHYTLKGVITSVKRKLAEAFPDLSEKDRNILLWATRPGLKEVRILPPHLED